MDVVRLFRVRQHILTTAMEIITPEENPDRHVGRKRTAEKQLLIISINFLAFFGFAIIAYGLAAQIYQETWGVLERIANFVSTTSTLLGALLTFLSVYLKPNARPPEAVSKKYVAPFCIFIVVATGVVLISNPQSVHPHVVNGIAILAIAGGLFRTVST